MKNVILIVSLFIVGCFMQAAASAKVKDTQISHKKAVSICSSHGGGTDCSWCRGGRCHHVACNEGICEHVTVSNFRGKPGTVKVPASGVNGASAGSPPQPGPHRPVKIGSGVKPVVGSGDKGSAKNQIGKRH
jgi:hypothetical protein